MRKSTMVALCLLLPTTFCAGSAFAQKKKPETKKPPVTGGTKGTSQLAGDNGKFNTEYTIGSTGSLNIALTSVEFTATRVTIGENVYVPKSDEKILVVKYSVHNPNPAEMQYDWATLKFTAVSQDDVNREYVNAIGKQGTKESVSIVLKPSQKVDLFAAIVVPATGTVPKLIVEHVNGGSILRYDLRGKITGLMAPYADPTDKTGATALAQVPAPLNTYLSLGNFDVKFVSGAFEDGPLGEVTAEDGKRFFVANVTFKNLAPTASNYDVSVIIGKLETADGEMIDAGGLLQTKANATASGELAPKAEYTARYYFVVPKDAKVKTLRLSEATSHVLAVDVSAIK